MNDFQSDPPSSESLSDRQVAVIVILALLMLLFGLGVGAGLMALRLPAGQVVAVVQEDPVRPYYVGAYDMCMLFGRQAGEQFESARTICNDLVGALFENGWHTQSATEGFEWPR